jgi:hypothetical protein
MGILDRLEQVVKSYIHDDDAVYREKRRAFHNDPDVNAAFDELNEFLNKDKAAGEWVKTDSAGASGRPQSAAAPEELRPDFAELGVAFGASAEECKEAYKNLLKIHHPDRHATHEGNFTKATAKSARINAAYERIGKWRSGNTGS